MGAARACVVALAVFLAAAGAAQGAWLEQPRGAVLGGRRAGPGAEHWWQRWPWTRPWWGRPEPLQRVLVAPALPGGRGYASLAELDLPRSRIEAEGLQPLERLPAEQGLPGGSSSSSSSGRGSATPASSSSSSGGSSSNIYSYNSSDLTPLVPFYLAWMTDVESMMARSEGLDFRAARTLAAYVAISYCNTSNVQPWNCTRCREPAAAGFTPHRAVFDEAWDLFAYVGYSEPLGGIAVVFRGTDSHSYYNWVENMRTWRTDLHIGYPGAPSGALVHGGFFTSYNYSGLAGNISWAVADLRSKYPDAPVFVAGHSLGGALATICAMDMRLNLGVLDVRVVTFGSPRVGNAVFAQWYEREVSSHWRFTHNRDIVPSVPPGYMGFQHVSREVWVVDLLMDRTLVGVCDGSGEDPLCHNSMCHLGLCSSITDHLLYLSEMYAPHPTGC